MPDTSYQIDYSSPPGKIVAQIDRIIAALDKLDKRAEKSKATLKSLGADMPGAKQAILLLTRLDSELKSKVVDAGKAEAALKKVGSGNSAVTSLTTRLKALEAELKAIQATAGTAGAALGGVGGGANLPGRGGAGKGGAGGGGTFGAGAVMLGSMGAMAGRAALRKTIGAVKEGLQDRVSYFARAADTSAEFRESLREYATLRNEPGPNDKIMNEALNFAKQAKVLPDEITPFLTQYEGSAATGRLAGNIGGSVERGEITPEAQQALEAKLKVRGAKFATRVGLDARTAGDLTGVISTYRKLTSEEDLAGELHAMHYGLNEGRGEISPLMRAELSQAGDAIKSKKVSGLPELSAFIGVASIIAKTPGSSGTTYGQLSRLLNDVGDPDDPDDDKSQFHKDSGMADAKGDFNKLKALKAHIDKIKPDNLNNLLKSKGYGNYTDRRTLGGLIDMVNVLEKRRAETKRRAANGKEGIALDEANQKEQASINRGADVEEYKSIVETGMIGEPVRAAETKARSRMGNINQPGGQTLKGGIGTYLSDMVNSGFRLGAVSGEDIRVGSEANKALERRGAMVGSEARKQTHRELGDFANPEARARTFKALEQEIIAKEGDPHGGTVGGTVAQKLDAAGNLIKSAAKDAAQGNRRGGPAPPPPPMPGTGGAGFNPGRR